MQSRGDIRYGLALHSASAFCPVVPARGAIVERQPRMLNFCVEYRSTNVDVVLEESSSVGEIKQILETELHVPVSKMQLKGWKTGDVTDSTVLRSLHLPKNNSLYVLTPDIAPTATTSQSGTLQESLNQNFLLVISHHEAQRDYSLNFPGSKTIQEIKRNIYDLTNIPVRHQQWEGWPATARDDSMTLAVAGISFPCHRLTVCRRTSPAHTQEQSEECTDVHMVSDSEGDDFEDASEFGVDEGEIFGMGTSASRKSPMMPENAENEGDALLHFTAEFSSRYGECHPVFFIGSLEAAFQETFYGKARDCTDVHMVSDSEGDDFEDASEFGVDEGEIFGMGTSASRKSPMMPENAENEGDALLHFTAEFSSRYGECHPVFFIGSLEAAFQETFYGKARDCYNDLNHFKLSVVYGLVNVSHSLLRLLTMCTRHFGSVVAQTIRTYKTDQFPLLLIVMGKRSSNEVLNVIQGNTTVDELMMRLMAAMEIFTAQQQEDIRDEDEREARELVKREQDEAYRVSLEADRAKREAQEREMAEQVRLEQIRKEQEDEREVRTGAPQQQSLSVGGQGRLQGDNEKNNWFERSRSSITDQL
ncbi:UNVERIFIED_CONTAM: hypothetical protein FKN15_069602 [Acipenser sinensis]